MPQLQGRYRIIDARAGEEVRLRKTICYHDGECWRLLRIDHFGRRVFIDHNRIGTVWVKLAVRSDHPNYPGETVAFVPS